MKTFKNFFLLFILGSILSSCSPALTPFSQDLYEQNMWTENELKQIQFYLSEDIVLRREFEDGISEIVSGEIKMIDGKEVDEVKFRKGTPGVLLFMPKEKRFAISFEEGGKERFLVFGPSPKVRDRYVLMASEWKRSGGKVTYEGKKYDVDTHAAFASLLVDLEKVRKISVNSRTAQGRTVGQD